MSRFDPNDDPETRRANADYATVPDRKYRDGHGCTSGCAQWAVTAFSLIGFAVAMALA